MKNNLSVGQTVKIIINDDEVGWARIVSNTHAIIEGVLYDSDINDQDIVTYDENEDGDIQVTSVTHRKYPNRKIIKYQTKDQFYTLKSILRIVKGDAVNIIDPYKDKPGIMAAAAMKGIGILTLAEGIGIKND